MNINEVFDSKYLRAADLKGQTPICTITKIDMQDMKDGQVKPCIYLNHKDKGLVLNKTNANMIAKLYGPETDAWIGKKIMLITAWVEYQGDTVEAIRIRPPNMDPMAAQAPMEPPPPRGEDDYSRRDADPEVPF